MERKSESRRTKSNETKRHAKKSPVFFVLIILIIVALLGFGFFETYKTAKNQGYSEGYEARKTETDANLNKIAELLSEKLSLQEKSKELFSDDISKLNSETIEVYINNVDSLKQSATDESAKKSLHELTEALNEFRAVYETKDNSAIEEKFEELKTKIQSSMDALNEVYNSQIRLALENL